MMLRSRSQRGAQPPLSARTLDRLPAPFLLVRPRPSGLPLQIESPRGAILTGNAYTGITLDQSRYGWGLKSAAGTSDGIVITLSNTAGTAWGRTTWCWMGLFRVDTAGSTGTLVSLNGALSGLQARINTSSQFELLSEANALLVTSTYAGFTAGSIHAIAIYCSALLGTTTVYANGQAIATYAGTIDIKDPGTAMEMALLRRGNTGEKLAGTLFGAAFFCGVSQVPSPAMAQWLTTATGYYSIFRTRRRGRPQSAGATPRTATASLAAAVQAARTAAASLAAAVQVSHTASASAAAAVQVARSASASGSVAVQQSRSATASVAAAIQAVRTATASIAAAVQRGQAAAASLDAAVQSARSASASADVAVRAPMTATASLTAYVQAGSTVTASLSAAVQAARSAQASLAAAVQTPRTAQASLAAAVAQAHTVSASLAAGVREARTASASLSAQVQAGTTVVALLSAAVREARAASASIAAAVAVARTASASLSTAIAVQRSLTALFQGAVQAGRTASASLSAYISTPGSHTISPRLYLVDPQDRAYLIDPEDRTYIVPASSRSTAA